MIEATAPVRICDVGGWTDTWFGGPGRVLHVAVGPGAEVSVGTAAGPDPVVLDVPAFGERYPVTPGAGPATRSSRHPLLEAAVDACPPPRDVAVEITVRTGVPAGCGAGTSAAVAVAMLAALTVARSERWAPPDLARQAHRLEVGVLGGESGVQDQVAAAYGGINYMEVGTYPEATVHPLPAWEALASRLVVVYLGRAHDSSALHRRVVEHLSSAPGGSGRLDRLREAAVAARDAVLARDLDAFGRAMVAGTEAQRGLHPALVGADAARVIEIGQAAGAIGWKVNGAGGDGGSVTLLAAEPGGSPTVMARIAAADRRYRVLPVTCSPVGVQVRGAL